MCDFQVRGTAGRRRSSSDSQASPTPDPAISLSYPLQGKAWLCGSGKRSRRGEWWSTDLGVLVEIGNDFVPDTQDGGGDNFFFPNLDRASSKELATGSEGDLFDDDATSVRGGEDETRDRGLMRANEHLQRLRRHFPPLPSLADDLRNFLSSVGRKDDKLLLRCGIKPSMHPTPLLPTTNLDDLVDDELVLDEESQAMVNNEMPPFLVSSSTRSGAMFKSTTPYPPSPRAAAAAGMSSYGTPSTASVARMFRSRKPPPPIGPSTATVGMSSYGPLSAAFVAGKKATITCWSFCCWYVFIFKSRRIIQVKHHGSDYGSGG